MPSLSPVALETRSDFAASWLVTISDLPADSSGNVIVDSGGRLLKLVCDDPASGPQAWRMGTAAIVLDGMLYDRDDLVGRIDASRHDSDAALVLKAYQRWGVDSVARLKGLFAFVIWDGSAGRLLAARDRVGMYPLFHCRRGDDLYFSTSVDGFVLESGPGLEVNRMAVASMLAKMNPEPEDTFHESVRRVPPGSLLHGTTADPRVERYWKLPPVGDGAEWVHADEMDRFGELLDQAVGRALQFGQGGIFLSGGLDSVSVAAAALEHSRAKGLAKPEALSLLFPGEVREEGVQRGVADQLGINQTTLELDAAVGPAGLLQASLDLSSKSSAPLQNFWLPAYRRLGQIAKERGCRSILTGGGGDEWLSVTPVIGADYIRSFNISGLVRFVLTMQRSIDVPVLPLWRNVLWSNGLNPLLKHQKRRLLHRFSPEGQRRRLERQAEARKRRIPDWLVPDESLKSEVYSRIDERSRKRCGADPALGPGGFYFKELEYSLQHPLLALDLEEMFETSRQQGLRQFDIYWDADLIEFLYRVPPHLLSKGGRSKGLVRNDLARRFPDLGFGNQKKLVSRDFFCRTLLDQSRSAWQSLGGAPALAELGIVEPHRLEGFVRKVLATGDEQHVDEVWRILSLESWVRPRVQR